MSFFARMAPGDDIKADSRSQGCHLPSQSGRSSFRRSAPTSKPPLCLPSRSRPTLDHLR